MKRPRSNHHAATPLPLRAPTSDAVPVDVSRLVDHEPPDRSRPHTVSPLIAWTYKPTWALLFVSSLSYLAAVAFAPSYLPGQLGNDVEAHTAEAPQEPNARRDVAAAPASPAKSTSGPPAAPPPEPAKVAAASEPVKPTVINAQPAPAPAQPPGPRTPQIASTHAPIETGTLPRDGRTGASYGVQIGSAPSLDTLRLVWTRLVDRHRTPLAGTEPRFIASESNLYALVAGPFATEGDARTVCAEFTARNDQCRVRSYAGDALF